MKNLNVRGAVANLIQRSRCVYHAYFTTSYIYGTFCLEQFLLFFKAFFAFLCSEYFPRAPLINLTELWTCASWCSCVEACMVTAYQWCYDGARSSILNPLASERAFHDDTPLSRRNDWPCYSST